MNPVLVTVLCLMGPLAALQARGEEGRSRRPNIVLIMADDLGYETIGANGGTSYRTPILDALAADGVRFTHCYAQPLCTPTRVQLMTGQSNARNYVRFGLLDPKLRTFGNLLKEAGYATCVAGKWQLGGDAEQPRRFGFDEYCLWQHLRRPPRYANPGLEINGVRKDYTGGEYGPDLVNDFVLDFIERKKDGPFFVYYPMILTHAPFQPTPDSPDWDPKTMGEESRRNVRHFGEMVAYMDRLVGRVAAKLDALGLRRNTLLLFLGDNGTARSVRSRMGDREVQGGKGLTTAAGMHVPLIASWPAGIARGRVCDDLIDTTDFLPTLLEAAGARPDRGTTLDGRSFLPQLRGRRGSPRPWIYAWYCPRQPQNLKAAPREFVFDRRHKLYRNGEFYDLVADRDETRPLAVAVLTGDAAEAAKRLQSALNRFKEVRGPAAPDA